MTDGYRDQVLVQIDQYYYREQFDDWLAGGSVRHNDKVYFWQAENNNRGFGWDVTAIFENEREIFDEAQRTEIIWQIEKACEKYEHKTCLADVF